MMISALVLASSVAAASGPQLRLVEPKKAFSAPMFHPPSSAGRTVVPGLLKEERSPSGAKPSFRCHILVTKPDPELDPKMAIEAPATDPNIVRRSVCAEPSNE